MVKFAKGLFLYPKKIPTTKISPLLLLKPLPHVKDWWETYYEKHSTKESAMFGTKPTWTCFINAIKE